MTALSRARAQSVTGASAGELSLAGVSKHYAVDGASLTVLKDVDLTVAPGEFLSIVGASGCGKSTLLRLIVGLDAEYEGDIRLDGAPLVSTSLDRGLVFQDHRLFPWMTVAQNVEIALLNRNFSKTVRGKLVGEYLDLVNLTAFAGAYPHQLSGGMAQRAAIARALINEPKVLLLDEPFGALDALTRLRLQHELQRVWRRTGATMVMVTHDVEEALYLGDRVVVMRPNPGRVGRIVPVPLPHPRDRGGAVFGRLKDEILVELMGPEAGDGDAQRGGVLPIRPVA